MGSSSKKRLHASRKQNEDLVSHVANDYKQSRAHGDDAALIPDDMTIEKRYGIVEESDWWEQSNKHSDRFDLDDEEVRQNIVRAYGAQCTTDGNYNESHYPPQDVLKQAAEDSRLSKETENPQTIVETISFRLWVSRETHGKPNLKKKKTMPSLDDARKELKAKADAAKVKWDGNVMYQLPAQAINVDDDVFGVVRPKPGSTLDYLGITRRPWEQEWERGDDMGKKYGGPPTGPQITNVLDHLGVTRRPWDKKTADHDEERPAAERDEGEASEGIVPKNLGVENRGE